MIVQARWSLDPCADCRSATPGRRGLGSGRASRNGADEQPTATALHVFFAPAGLLCGDQFPTDRARPFSPRKRRPPCEHPLSYSSCWTFLLGTALLAPSPSRAIVDVPTRCCRGEGPDAYCCHLCCVRGPYCEHDSDCRDAD